MVGVQARSLQQSFVSSWPASWHLGSHTAEGGRPLSGVCPSLAPPVDLPPGSAALVPTQALTLIPTKE